LLQAGKHPCPLAARPYKGASTELLGQVLLAAGSEIQGGRYQQGKVERIKHSSRENPSPLSPSLLGNNLVAWLRRRRDYK
jgi:hypothetical protein